MIGFIILIALANAVICATFTGQVAKLKGYESSGWQVAGLLCGPLALIAIAGMPDMKMRDYVKAIAERQGITSKVIDSIKTKTEEKSVAKFGNSPLEDYEAVVALYKSKGGKREPDYKKSNVFSGTITLKDDSGKTLASFSREGSSLWRVIYVTI